jgi:hypothetical protein
MKHRKTAHHIVQDSVLTPAPRGIGVILAASFVTLQPGISARGS